MAERRGYSSRPIRARRGLESTPALAPAAPPGRTTYLDRPGHVPRWTSGRECCVFRADGPEQLCGYHPELIRTALAPEDAFRYLLYSPLFEGAVGPFRVGGRPGSHAVGITRSRFVVSRDPHAEAPPRSVTTIDLDEVWCLEIGCALVLGWFVIRFAGRERPQHCTVPFSHQGIRHFRALARAYRRTTGARSAAEASKHEWNEAWRDTPAYLRTELEPLIGKGERLLAVLRSPERWTIDKRLWRRRALCTSTAGLLLATSGGVLWAAGEPRVRPEALAFGVNVTVVRPERVAGASIRARDGLGVLRLRACEGPHPHELEVPFDGKDVAQAEQIVHLVRDWRGRP